MEPKSWMRLVTRAVRSLVVIALTLVVLNDGGRYALAWYKVLLAQRDVNAAIQPVIKTAPSDRRAAGVAALGAARRHGVDVVTYDQRSVPTATGCFVSTTTALRCAVPGTWVLGHGAQPTTARAAGLPSAEEAAPPRPMPVITFTARASFGFIE